MISSETLTFGTKKAQWCPDLSRRLRSMPAMIRNSLKSSVIFHCFSPLPARSRIEWVKNHYLYLLDLTCPERGRRLVLSKYIVNFTDIKGGISFLFRKILITPEELKKYKDRDKLYRPFEDDFSKEEMVYFMKWFVFYLVGFMESFGKHYKEEFARSLDYLFAIYGFKDGKFFMNFMKPKIN